MKKVILVLSILLLAAGNIQPANAFNVLSGHFYQASDKKVYKSDLKQIKSLFKLHNEYANRHDLDSLSVLYSDKYVNNDGFDKKVYFQSIKDTWEMCKDITYKTKIVDIQIEGDYASVQVEESAVGTVFDTLDYQQIAGEIHSTATGYYHLTKVNGKWLISGETAVTDNSSLLYGDARYINMELNAPNQINAGEQYTASVNINADENTFIIGSITNDAIKYPPLPPANNLRAVPQSHVLERILSSNKDNLNEYTVVTLAISKAKNTAYGSTKISLTGMACLMKRVNVVPANSAVSEEK